MVYILSLEQGVYHLCTNIDSLYVDDPMGMLTYETEENLMYHRSSVRAVKSAALIIVQNKTKRIVQFHNARLVTIPSSHSVDKKCGNTTNWGTIRVFLKS